MTIRVGVIGAGPAGLLAAHGAIVAGAEATIFSPKKQSVIGGAQYLHRHIPGITSSDPDGQLTFIKEGDPETYAKKVYDDPFAPTSWGDYPAGTVDIWNMRAAYEHLWMRYEGLIRDQQLGPKDVVTLAIAFDRLFLAAPRAAFCTDADHSFYSQRVWITQEEFTAPDSCIYNGKQNVPWYRASTIFGHSSAEYGHEVPVKSVCVNKPLRTDCDCLGELVVRVGRYGEWRKPVLIHHAYEKAYETVKALRA